MLKAVTSVMPEYAGGTTVNPTYEAVCSGETGHAEVIEVKYDAEKIALTDILSVFFATHDPTTLNRQGNDIGTQYRSVIFTTSDEQKTQAEKFTRALNDSAEDGKPIVTEVKPLDVFYPAENYHRDYFARNADKSYCQVIINPKLEKAKKRFSQLLKQ